jgi:tetratricopeptide (TPR) repeat protein
MMMNESEEHAFDEILRKLQARNDSQALLELRELAKRVEDPRDKAWLKYNETRFLVEMGNATEARQCLEELKTALALLVASSTPSDGSESDASIGLPMLARHAEIRVTTEEGRVTEALRLIEDFVSSYPRELSLSEFKDLSEEVRTLRGFLLAGMGRWQDAKLFLEGVNPPEPWRAQHCYFLGRCYYEDKEYEHAQFKLLESLTPGLPSSWEGQAHYILGIVEYHLSDVEAARKHFELSMRTTDPKDLDDRIWGWLETTSRALGMYEQAEKYRRMRGDSPREFKPN